MKPRNGKPGKCPLCKGKVRLRAFAGREGQRYSWVCENPVCRLHVPPPWELMHDTPDAAMAEAASADKYRRQLGGKQAEVNRFKQRASKLESEVSDWRKLACEWETLFCEEWCDDRICADEDDCPAYELVGKRIALGVLLQQDGTLR